MNTQGPISSATPNTDGQIWIGASAFAPLVAASAPLASAGAGLLTLNVPSSTTANLFSVLNAILRTGQLASAARSQRQFGTAALVPGPSTVANTGSPLSISGYPPFTQAQNPTLTGGFKGALGKGVQINYADLIYEIDTGAITSVTVGLTQTKMPAIGTPAAPVVSNIIALGANSLPVAANTAGQATRTRVTVAAPAMLTVDAGEIIANVNFVVPAANTVKFYGAILGVSFNFN